MTNFPEFKFNDADFVAFLKTKAEHHGHWDYTRQTECPIAQYFSSRLSHPGFRIAANTFAIGWIPAWENHVCEVSSRGYTLIPPTWDMLVRTVYAEAGLRKPTWAELYARAWTTFSKREVNA